MYRRTAGRTRDRWRGRLQCRRGGSRIAIHCADVIVTGPCFHSHDRRPVSRPLNRPAPLTANHSTRRCRGRRDRRRRHHGHAGRRRSCNEVLARGHHRGHLQPAAAVAVAAMVSGVAAGNRSSAAVHILGAVNARTKTYTRTDSRTKKLMAAVQYELHPFAGYMYLQS
jgi:hypothetical protein